MRKQVQEIFAKMQMRITKWSSNSVALLKTIPKEELSPYEEIDENHDGFLDYDELLKAYNKHHTPEIAE